MIENDLSNLQEMFPQSFTEEQKSRGKTLFYKKLSLRVHGIYRGKMQTIPKVPMDGFNWLNVWYTPGVSSVSTAIRDDNNLSYQLSNRSNLVAVLSDSTRVLGDGDCTPPGGLGVMEGKAFLMKYLGGLDAVAICVDSKDETGKNNPDKLITFGSMLQHSFGAINLEDISQPNCFKVLDELRQKCDIPVWHDDAQGTACITLAALINALKLVQKDITKVKIVFYGAGAANTSIAQLVIADGANAENIIMFDIDGALHRERKDYKDNPLTYRQWELCEKTNPKCITNVEDAFSDADVLIALSKPGPDTIKPEWIKRMAEKSIVFACSNPVPEIYPHAAKEAGAYIVATGRGDFPNQVNNSVCFPSVLKGTLLVQARQISNGMAIAAAHAIAAFAEKRGFHPDNIIPKMTESEVFPIVATEVAMQAIAEGHARIVSPKEMIYKQAKQDIQEAQELLHLLMEQNIIKHVNKNIIEEILHETIAEIQHSI
ncbi:MAG: NADP-dependent malic enzyme [Bacteroidales bacterium]|jgi:malate dehydrogenase (oxaloacetate-decarboxylating)|nr:NADP-dependent malic enzyme [Bacteroidales bacterium]